MALTVGQLEMVEYDRDGIDVPPGSYLVGVPFGHVKVAVTNYNIHLLPALTKNHYMIIFWGDAEKSDPYYGWRHRLAPWQMYLYDPVVPEGAKFTFKVTAKDKVVVMTITPDAGHYTTLSFKCPTYDGKTQHIRIVKDDVNGTTTLTVRVEGYCVLCVKANRAAKGASITDESTYADVWASGGSEETYDGAADKYAQISFDGEVQLRIGTALDGYMSDVDGWVGDPTAWEPYEDVVASVKQAWLDYINGLPLQLQEFEVNFYRALTAFIGNWLNATDPRLNGYKRDGLVPADTPFLGCVSSSGTWTHEFQGSFWDMCHASFYLLCLLDKTRAKEFVEGMLALAETRGEATSYLNIFLGTIDDVHGYIDDTTGFWVILSTALGMNLDVDWNSAYAIADTAMQKFRTFYGGVADEGYFKNSPANTIDLIHRQYLLAFLAKKAGDDADYQFYKSFAESESLFELMYVPEENRFTIPGWNLPWEEGETNSDLVWWAYSLCAAETLEKIVTEDYLAEFEDWISYHNGFNDMDTNAPFLLAFHGLLEKTWYYSSSLYFASLDDIMTRKYTITEGFATPRTGNLYQEALYEGYTSNLAIYILLYLGLYTVAGYPFTIIGVPQTTYTIGGLTVVSEGSGHYVEKVTFNGFEWPVYKLPADIGTLNGVLRICRASDPNAYKKSRYALVDQGYYSFKDVVDRPFAGKFKFTVSSPVSCTHTIRLHFEPAPLKVFGAESWSYDEAEKILTLTVKTGSEATVTVIYGEPCPAMFSPILDRYGVSATVKRNQPVTADDYGNPVPNWVEVASENIIVQPLKAEEKFMLPGVFQDADAKAFLRPDSLVEPGDRIIISEEETYQVLTVLPQRLGRCVHHLLAALKLVREEEA